MRFTLPMAMFFAASREVLAADQQSISPLGAESLLQTSGGLLLILLLIFGAAWLFKRFGQLPMGGKGVVTVLGGASVGPRERVVVVQVEQTRLVLGVAPGQVRKLHLLDEEQQSEASFEAHLEQATQSENRTLEQ
jgi:flagellar protein FliO/FliZ